MKREIIIEVKGNKTSIALLEDGVLQEFNVEDNEGSNCAVGDVYLGVVKKISPSLNAAFVSVGSEKEGFLHYSDMGVRFRTQQVYFEKILTNCSRLPSISRLHQEPIKEKEGQIADLIKVGDVIPVQIMKEAINTKGPRLSSDLSIAGRNIVLLPFSDKVLVSSKISTESERKRLHELLLAIKPEGFGCIGRTLAEGKKVADLDKELSVLKKRWFDLLRKVQNIYSDSNIQNKEKKPFLLYKEVGRAMGFIRDVFGNDSTSVYINDEKLRDEIKSYIELFLPENLKKIKLYKGQEPIFDHFGVTRQLKVGMGRTVSLKNGGYLVIDRTEALVAIDVNSGSKKIFEDPEQNAFEYNKLAAEEIAHLLRLRDLGGIIIIDFIDMENKKNQQTIYDMMCSLLLNDRAKHNVLPLSKFGLMQITRQRIRPALDVTVTETCPMCMGKGKIQSSMLFHENIENKIMLMKEKLVSAGINHKTIVHLHPYIYSFISKGLFWMSIKHQWQQKYNVTIIQDEQLGIMDCEFFEPTGQPVSLPTSPK